MRFFSRGLRIGRLLGIEIVINPTWLIIFLLVAVSFGDLFSTIKDFPGGAWPWLVGLVTALVFFACLLLHELSHSYVARRNGMKINRITLFIFGGVAEMGEEMMAAGVEFRMAIAGPAATFTLSGVFFGLYALGTHLQAGIMLLVPLYYLAWLNLAIGVFNLLPGFPLDGGRVFRAVVWKVTGDLRRATKLASFTGQGFGVLIAGGGLVLLFLGNMIGGIWFVLIGLFLYRLAQSSYQQTLLRLAASGTRVEDVMYTDVPVVDSTTPLTSLRLNYFGKYHLPAFPVSRNGDVTGMVIRDDLLQVPNAEWDVLDAGRIARPLESEQVVPPDTPLEKVLKTLMRGQRFMLVMENREVRGLLTSDEVSRYVQLRAKRIKSG